MRIWTSRFALLAVLALWAAIGIWGVPIIISWVHQGGGPAVLASLMEGRAQVPVEAYLDDWRQLALQVTFVLVTTAIVAWCALPLVALRATRDAGPPDAGTPAARLGLPAVLWVSAWFGLVVGLGESHYIAWKTLVLDEIIPEFRYASVDSLWMAPVSDVVTFVTLGVAAWGVGRLIGRPLTLWWLTALSATVGLSSLTLVTGRLYFVAALVLSIALAFRLAPVAARHQQRFLQNARRTVPLMGTAVVVVGLLVIILPKIAERRALARLPDASAGMNVLVIVIDTERASNLSLYGYDRDTTPNLDRLARSSIVFDRAMSPAPWTLPSHASMFTGRHPGELGTTFVDPLDDTFPTLAEVLSDRGYATAGFVANIYFCTPFFGVSRGFTHYEAQPRSVAMTLASSWLIRSAYRSAEDLNRAIVVKDAEDITQRFLSWQAAQPAARPFFAFLNYFDVHGPYNSPPSYRARFNDGSTDRPAHRGTEAANYAPRELQSLENAYDGAIAYVDGQLGVLFAELERRGQLERTLVVVTSDHGEEFGEHDSVGHSSGIHLPLIHVPLLVRHPSLPGGMRVSPAVSLVDLPATVLEAIGGDARAMPGRSWLRFVGAADAPRPGGEPVFSEYQTRQSVVLGDWHYIRDNGESLYNIRLDPREQVNRIEDADPATLAALRSTLDEFASRRRPGEAMTSTGR